jgi:quinol monooxygenase YgiN
LKKEEQKEIQMIKVIAKFTVKSDSIDTFKTITAKMIEPTRAEAGCLSYKLYQDQNDPTLFIFVEEWESGAALDAHLNSPTLVELGPQLEQTYAKDLELNILNLVY